jgi:hypothetical protein
MQRMSRFVYPPSENRIRSKQESLLRIEGATARSLMIIDRRILLGFGTDTRDNEIFPGNTQAGRSTR